MHRITLITALVCVCAAGQDAGFVSAMKAPAGMNEALKARVSGFYQAFVDGKFRKADEFVAEDSKDSFFSMEKKPYTSFQVMDLYYTPDFKVAKVITKVSSTLNTPRYGSMQMQPVVMTMWRFENNNWFWFDPAVTGSNSVDTPFGKMTFGPVKNAGPTIMGQKRISAEEVMQQIAADKRDITLSPSKGGAEVVTITNGLPGAITVEVDPYPELPGLTVQVEKSNLLQNEKAVVRFAYAPPGSGPVPPYMSFTIHVPQTGQRFPVRLDFVERQPRKQ